MKFKKKKNSCIGLEILHYHHWFLSLSFCSNISSMMKTEWFPALLHSWFHTVQMALLKPYSKCDTNSFSVSLVFDYFIDYCQCKLLRMGNLVVLIFCNPSSSPQVAGLSTRFRFGPAEDVLSQASASHSDLGQLASQGGTIYTCMNTQHVLVLPSVLSLTVLIVPVAT